MMAMAILLGLLAGAFAVGSQAGTASCVIPPADRFWSRQHAGAGAGVGAAGSVSVAAVSYLSNIDRADDRCPPPAPVCSAAESVELSSYFPGPLEKRGSGQPAAFSCWLYDSDVKAKRCTLVIDNPPAALPSCWQQCARDAEAAGNSVAWELLPGVSSDGWSTGPHTVCAIYHDVPTDRALAGPAFDTRSVSGCTSLGVRRDNVSISACCKGVPPPPPPAAPDWHCTGGPCWQCVPKPTDPRTPHTGIPKAECHDACWPPSRPPLPPPPPPSQYYADCVSSKCVPAPINSTRPAATKCDPAAKVIETMTCHSDRAIFLF